jgi:hypothetical protein
MLGGDTIHDPLLLYFIAVKRQPFLISGFLDTGEFVVLKLEKLSHFSFRCGG